MILFDRWHNVLWIIITTYEPMMFPSLDFSQLHHLSVHSKWFFHRMDWRPSFGPVRKTISRWPRRWWTLAQMSMPSPRWVKGGIIAHGGVGLDSSLSPILCSWVLRTYLFSYTSSYVHLHGNCAVRLHRPTPGQNGQYEDLPQGVGSNLTAYRPPPGQATYLSYIVVVVADLLISMGWCQVIKGLPPPWS